MFNWLTGKNKDVQVLEYRDKQIKNGHVCRRVQVKQVDIGDMLSNGKRVRGKMVYRGLGHVDLSFEGTGLVSVDIGSYVWVVCEGE